MKLFGSEMTLLPFGVFSGNSSGLGYPIVPKGGDKKVTFSPPKNVHIYRREMRQNREIMRPIVMTMIC